MATTYVIRTNGVQNETTYTSKARAIKEAELISAAAETRNAGDVVTVATEKTNKIVFEYTNDIDFSRASSELLGDESTTDTGDAETAVQSLECTCSKGAPSPGNSPCLHCGGDNSWCAAHYPAPPVADGTDVRFPIVETHGAEEFDATPDMSVLTGDCFYGCGRPVTGMFCDYVGKTEGVCDLDRDKLGDHITVVPVDPAVWGGASETGTAVVGIVQSTPGMSGTTHYHVPGCRDIAREMRRHGQSQSDAIEFTFHSVAEILAFEYGDIASSEAESGTSEWWTEIVYNAQTDKSLGDYGFGVKIMPCLSIPMGDAGDSPLVMVNGEFRIGETLAPPVMDAFESVSNGYGAVAALSTGAGFHTVPENDTDGGFFETMVTKEYELSVVVDESTGASVSLGWVTLTMNAAQVDDYDRVAEEYGRTHGQGKPRHGWASIIRVHDVADI